ncbi:MAG TPA: Rho termination factor N-terminal domain-containing protein, partial [Ferruginibacter sp.]|nr:Rho termination factor N-terminal domain-containing protein [Ferruginibacter sp.]
MYDILQLNELLVPELLDIADQLDIPNTKKLNKQDLVSIILNKQAVMTADNKTPGGEKPKRKRILKSDMPATPAPKEKEKEEAPAKEEAPKKEATAHKIK